MTEPGTRETQPWQWDEATWRGRVGRVRAGRDLTPAAWPGGARVAVAQAASGQPPGGPHRPLRSPNVTARSAVFFVIDFRYSPFAGRK